MKIIRCVRPYLPLNSDNRPFTYIPVYLTQQIKSPSTMPLPKKKKKKKNKGLENSITYSLSLLRPPDE